jgi:acetylglutamate kinase
MARALGVPSKFEGGLRVTDTAALEVAAAVLRGVVNSELVAACGTWALTRSACRRGRRPACRGARARISASSPRRRAAARPPRRGLVGGQVPVVAPLARDEDGIVCNVNADDAAAGIAVGLGARQLVLMTDVDGVRDASRVEARHAQRRERSD